MNRPGVNRPTVNRPNINRPTTIINRPDNSITINRPTTNIISNISNTTTNTSIVNRPGYNRPGYNRPGYSWAGYNRPGYNRPYGPVVNGGWGGWDGRFDGGWGGHYDAPYARYHSGWYNGSFARHWDHRPSIWSGIATGLAAGITSAAIGNWLAPMPTMVYSNPYYLAPSLPGGPAVVESNTYIVPPALNYAEPIPVPTPEQAEKVEDTVSEAAMRRFEAARDAFKRGLYDQAQAEVERAIQTLPGDPTMHEFRALTLFARGRYQEATGTLYAVLSAGPGWDWDTLSALYGDADSYTRQLRALETHIRENTRAAEARFVLGYHYLVLDNRDDARAVPPGCPAESKGPAVRPAGEVARTPGDRRRDAGDAADAGDVADPSPRALIRHANDRRGGIRPAASVVGTAVPADAVRAP